LVLTAKNPGFTPEQSERTITSLRDLRDGLRKLPHIRPLWRIRPDIAAELGVDHEIKECASAELVATVERADAVIATASTAMLESMFLDRPVALLDYHNCPRFVQTAWCISAPDHILPVVEEILNPPAAKLAFQRDCLMDNLEIDGRACERVRALIQKTTAIAEQCRVEKRPLQFPANLLAWENRKTLWRKPPLAALYPGQSVFEDDDVLSLQVRLARAHRENRSLSEENLSLKRRLRIATLVRDAFRTVAGGMRLHRAADARS
jgi:hypothetical protein